MFTLKTWKTCTPTSIHIPFIFFNSAPQILYEQNPRGMILHIGSNMSYSKLCPQLFRFKIFDYIDLEYVILSTSNMKVPLSNARCQFHQYLVHFDFYSFLFNNLSKERGLSWIFVLLNYLSTKSFPL